MLTFGSLLRFSSEEHHDPWNVDDSLFRGQGKVRRGLEQPVLLDGMCTSIKFEKQHSKDKKANVVWLSGLSASV